MEQDEATPLELVDRAIEALKRRKPAERSESARLYAIAITMAEQLKAFVFWMNSQVG